MEGVEWRGGVEPSGVEWSGRIVSYPGRYVCMGCVCVYVTDSLTTHPPTTHHPLTKFLSFLPSFSAPPTDQLAELAGWLAGWAGLGWLAATTHQRTD